MLNVAVFAIEILFAHDQQKNAFDNSKDEGNSGPAEQQIDNAPANAAKVEFMDAKTAQKQGKQGCGQFAFAIWRHCGKAVRWCELPHPAPGAYFGLCLDDRAALGTEFLIGGFVHGFSHILLLKK
jgi:hypothetical protein